MDFILKRRNHLIQILNRQTYLCGSPKDMKLGNGIEVQSERKKDPTTKYCQVNGGVDRKGEINWLNERVWDKSVEDWLWMVVDQGLFGDKSLRFKERGDQEDRRQKWTAQTASAVIRVIYRILLLCSFDKYNNRRLENGSQY